MGWGYDAIFSMGMEVDTLSRILRDAGGEKERGENWAADVERTGNLSKPFGIWSGSHPGGARPEEATGGPKNLTH